MITYIAELDDTQRIVAVWIKNETARGPCVFDPRKHIFDDRSETEFCGASKDQIVGWMSAQHAKALADATL